MSIRPRLRVLSSAAAAMAAAMLPASVTLAAGEPEPVQRYVGAVNRGDVEAALALFTDDARLVAGPDCTEPSPCIGKAEIRSKFLEPMFAQRLKLVPMRVEASSAESVRVDLALELDEFREMGFDELRGTDEFRLRGGRIASVLFRFDPAHPPTGRFLRMMAESAARRAAAPAAPAASTAPSPSPGR